MRHISKKLLRFLSITIWTIFFATIGVTYYINHYLPHGPTYPTGEIICQNDERGPCGEEYKEDMSNIDIPSWAKFLREYFLIVIIGQLILGAYMNNLIEDYGKNKTI